MARTGVGLVVPREVLARDEAFGRLHRDGGKAEREVDHRLQQDLPADRSPRIRPRVEAGDRRKIASRAFTADRYGPGRGAEIGPVSAYPRGGGDGGVQCSRKWMLGREPIVDG